MIQTIFLLAGVLLGALGAWFVSRMDVRNSEAQHQAELDKQRVMLESDIRLAQERIRMMEESRSEREEAQRKGLEIMREQFENSSRKLLRERQEELKQVNREEVGKIVDPVRQQMEEMRKLLTSTKEGSDRNISTLEGALKLMVEQTQMLGKEANTLADALRNRGKVHGDWGEQVLSDILEGSGLRPDIEYLTQVSYKGAHGNELRPDVVICCADSKRIIVDSKVSIKAYTDALGAENDEEREAAVKLNYQSVKQHVRELADKQYPKYVENSMAYVLMFIPNEGSYIMAMNYDRSLAQDAFRQGVIIVNPTNLMLALNLVLQTWQSTRQEDNCRKIIEAANGLYDKVIGLSDTMNSLDSQMATVCRTMDTARKQLSEGQGNVLRRVEGLKELGVTSTKTTRVRRAKTVELEIPNE